MRRALKAPDLLNGLLFLGTAMLPIYTLDSGGMQASHLLLFVFALGFVVKRGVGVQPIDVLMGAVVLIAFFREWFALMAGAPVSSLITVAHVLYVAMLVNAMRRALVDPSRFTAFRRGLFAAVFLAVGGVLLLGYGLTVDAEGGRAIGTFNNPNQLGYFAVCSACLAVVLKRRGDVGVAGVSLLLAAAVFLAAASLSKAAMLCIFALVLLSGYVMAPRRGVVIAGVVFATVASLAAWSMYEYGVFDDFVFVRRLQTIGTQSDDSLAARGYDIFNYANGPELLLGFGSAAVHDIRGKEIHSTIFSFFGNYGIIGGLLFVGVLVAWSLRVRSGHGWVGVVLFVVPPMAYGITHNGSRFTIFWLLVCASMAQVDRTSQRSAPATKAWARGNRHADTESAKWQ